MKLSVDTYVEDSPEIISSKLTPKMNTKIAVIANSAKDILSTKIYGILKREFPTVLAYRESNNQNSLSLDLTDIDYVKSFFMYNNIRILVITSEYLSGVTQFNQHDLCSVLVRVVEYCNERNIKVVYVSANVIFNAFDAVNKFKGLDTEELFVACNDKISNVIGNYKNNLVVKVSTFYGLNDLGSSVDFPEYVYQNLKNKKRVIYNSHIAIQPLLADECAISLGENLLSSGVIEFPCFQNETTFYQWALQIADKCSDFDKAQQYIIPSAPDFYKMPVVDHKSKYSSVNVGYDIERKQKQCAFNLIYKLPPTGFYGSESVASARILLGEKLAEEFSAQNFSEVDCVIPVPNTGTYYAMGLAKALKKPYIQALNKTSVDIRSFQVLDANVRKEIIKSKILPIPSLLKDRKVILVDEAIFTGTTLKVVCSMVRECGVKEIHLGIPSPQCKGLCPYYVQPSRAMLSEYVRQSMLPEYFNVDSVTFLGESAFCERMTSLGSGCMECWIPDKMKGDI